MRPVHRCEALEDGPDSLAREADASGTRHRSFGDARVVCCLVRPFFERPVSDRRPRRHSVTAVFRLDEALATKILVDAELLSLVGSHPVIAGDDDGVRIVGLENRLELAVDLAVDLADGCVVVRLFVEDRVRSLKLDEAELGVVLIGEIAKRSPRIRAHSL